MSEHDNNDEYDDHSDSEKRDVWFKLRAIGGVSTAVVAALIGVLGSIFLHSQQEATNKIHLYTQLMSEQEKAENAVRKDMFTTILTSFLDREESTNSECTMDKISRQLLELDMISRNFHETMDLRPLFLHVLLNIVKGIPRKYSITEEELESLDKLSSCKHKMLHNLLKKDEFKKANQEKKKELIKDYISKVKNRKKIKLINIARRITRKQLESLSHVEKRMRFTIDLTKTCDDIPSYRVLSEKDTCSEEGSEKGPTKLTLINDKKKGKTIARTFRIFSNRSYKDWNVIRLKVSTNKLKSEIEADRDGGENNTSEFWISFFDFPLVDNTFLSIDERYAVILDSINDEEAKVSLLYFPASYAGFKEKSYYQHRIINTLLMDRALTN